MQSQMRFKRQTLEMILRSEGINPTDRLMGKLSEAVDEICRRRVASGIDEWAHPAVQAVKDITRQRVPPGMYPALRHALGQAPDLAKLKECYEAWCTRGYNSSALTWALEWYTTGIPDHGPSASGKSTGPATLKEMGLA
jgi:hypothetical protein